METPFTILGWFHVILLGIIIGIPILLLSFAFVWYHISNIIQNVKELFKK